MLCFYKDFVFNVHEIPFIVYENNQIDVAMSSKVFKKYLFFM